MQLFFFQRFRNDERVVCTKQRSSSSSNRERPRNWREMRYKKKAISRRLAYLRDWRAPGVQHHLLRLLLFVSQPHRRRRRIPQHDGTPVSRNVTAERDCRHADAAQDVARRQKRPNIRRLCCLGRRRRPFPGVLLVKRRIIIYGRQQRARLRVKKTLGFFDVVVVVVV